MLILTRRPGEKLIINNGETEIVVLGIKGNQVRLGITAPIQITVHREEIQQKINKESESNGRTQQHTKIVYKAANRLTEGLHNLYHSRDKIDRQA